jgi:hypothetical protein
VPPGHATRSLEHLIILFHRKFEKVTNCANSKIKKFEFKPRSRATDDYKAYYYTLNLATLDKGNNLRGNMLQYPISSSKSIQLVSKGPVDGRR